MNARHIPCALVGWGWPPPSTPLALPALPDYVTRPGNPARILRGDLGRSLRTHPLPLDPPSLRDSFITIIYMQTHIDL